MYCLEKRSTYKMFLYNANCKSVSGSDRNYIIFLIIHQFVCYTTNYVFLWAPTTSMPLVADVP